MWTEEAVACLRASWTAGQSASEIARTLWDQTRFSTTRNAVIGKVHRLGLASRPQPAALARTAKLKKRRPAAAKIRMPVFKVQPPLPPESVVSLQVPFLDVRANQCRAVTDTTKWEQRCCGHEVALGSVYCASHHARFYCAVVAKREALAA